MQKSKADNGIAIRWNPEIERLEAQLVSDQRKTVVTYPAGRFASTVAEAKRRLKVDENDTFNWLGDIDVSR